jgi:hypothetical protein
MNYFGFWSSFYQLLDPDPGGKFNADPCGSGYGSGSETLNERNHFPPSAKPTLRYMPLDFVVVAEGLAAQRADSLVQVQLLYVLMLHLHVRTQLQINETFVKQQWQKLFFL